MVYKQKVLMLPGSCRNEEIIMPAFRMPKELNFSLLGIAWFIISLFIILFSVALIL